MIKVFAARRAHFTINNCDESTEFVLTCHDIYNTPLMSSNIALPVTDCHMADNLSKVDPALLEIGGVVTGMNKYIVNVGLTQTETRSIWNFFTLHASCDQFEFDTTTPGKLCEADLACISLTVDVAIGFPDYTIVYNDCDEATPFLVTCYDIYGDPLQSESIPVDFLYCQKENTLTPLATSLIELTVQTGLVHTESNIDIFTFFKKHADCQDFYFTQCVVR